LDNLEKLMATPRPYLTDGGFETWMFFVEGFTAPEFAAIVLMDDEAAREKMRAYFERFLLMAEAAQTGYILDTNTWRGCTRWASKLGLSQTELLRLSKDAVTFAQDISASWNSRVSPVLVNGVVGPAGDGYTAEGSPSAAEAEQRHEPQMDVFLETGVDMVSAIIMTNVPEAIGITRAAKKRNLPCVISFTVETDAQLPSGLSLAEAITQTDQMTGDAPLYYMINCAHTEHFQGVLDTDEPWVRRIGGIRANASRLSHEELDNAETLDDGNPQEFGDLHLALAERLPSLRVVGGCCGTDHRHIDFVSNHLHHKSTD
jgi:homocysteine S-methyltransferase